MFCYSLVAMAYKSCLFSSLKLLLCKALGKSVKSMVYVLKWGRNWKYFSRKAEAVLLISIRQWLHADLLDDLCFLQMFCVIADVKTVKRGFMVFTTVFMLCRTQKWLLEWERNYKFSSCTSVLRLLRAFLSLRSSIGVPRPLPLLCPFECLMNMQMSPCLLPPHQAGT